MRRFISRHAALWVALGSVGAWFAVLLWVNPGPIADEREHWPVICDLARGQWPAPGRISTLPTFHLLAAGAVRLVGESLWVARGVSGIATLGAWILLYQAAQVRHGPTAGTQLLLAAWNPLYFPYAVLAYTEPLTLLATAGALWAHVRRRYAVAAAALLFACFVRQSMLVWVVFFAVWSATEAVREGGGVATPGSRAGRWRAWPYVAASAVFGAFLLWQRAWAWAPHEQTRVGVNPAQFYLFGLLVAVVAAPLWVAQARALGNKILGPTLARGWPVTLLIVCVAAVALGYRNPHPWNSSANYLHDRVLRWIDTRAAVRCGAAAILVATAPLIVAFVYRQRDRMLLAAAWLFSLLFLLPHWLVDHRYAIFPLLFIHFCTRYSRPQARALGWWSALLCACAAAYLARYGGPNSGL